MSNKKSRLERTQIQNLLRDRTNGRYYASWTVAGKQKWKPLNNDVFSLAKLRLSDESEKIEKQPARKTVSGVERVRVKD